MQLVEVKYDVKLTHILEASVQCFNKNLYKIKHRKFIFRAIKDKNKVQCGQMFVDQFRSRSKDCINLDEIADTVRPCRQQLEDAADEVLMLLGGLVAVELEEAWLALRAHHHHGLDHG